MKHLTCMLVIALVRATTVVPFPLLYAISSLLDFLLFHGFRYRKTVVHTNLQRAFPALAEEDVQRHVRSFYRYLSDLVLESAKGLGMSQTEFSHRFRYRNAEVFDPYFTEGKSVILLGSHYGNWEWGVRSFPLAVEHQVVGIFKPVGNRCLNDWLNKQRSTWGLHLVNMAGAGRAVRLRANEPSIFVLIADQTPSDVKNAVWLPFLNRPTPFLHGAEKLARRTNYPVFVFEIARRKRGFYEVTFRPLCENPASAKPGDITAAYARHLAGLIYLEPAYWLWSHRRWKHSAPTS